MTRSSFAKNFNMAGEEEDVKNVFIVKNSLFHKNWKIYSFFVLPAIFIKKSAFDWICGACRPFTGYCMVGSCSPFKKKIFLDIGKRIHLLQLILASLEAMHGPSTLLLCTEESLLHCLFNADGR